MVEGSVVELLAGAYGAESRVVRSGPWVEVVRDPGVLPEQGWKLHLSAYPGGLGDLLDRLVPWLADYQPAVKVIASEEALERLSAGAGGATQVGKAVTVYPRSTAAAVGMAHELSLIADGLVGPVIPSDRACGPGVVWRRYGAFRSMAVRGPWGAVVPAIRAPDGHLVPDLRDAPGCPAWVDDPFTALGEPVKADEVRVLEGRFLRGPLLHSSYRSRVSLGVDLATGELCVLKAAVDGTVRPGSCRAQVDREHAALRELDGEPGFARVIARCEDGRDLVLVQSEAPGVNAYGLVESLSAAPAWERARVAVRVGIGVCHALAALLQRGRVHGDVSPGNVLVDGDDVTLVDLELAFRVGHSVPVLGTPGFASPQRRQGLACAPSDDIYAVGSLLRAIATGVDVSMFSQASAVDSLGVRVLRPDLPAREAAVIDACLQHEPACRPDLETLTAQLQDNGTADEGRRTPRFVDEAIGPDASIALSVDVGALAARLLDRLRKDVDEHLSRGVAPSIHWSQIPDLGNGTAGIAIALSACLRGGHQVEPSLIRTLLKVPQPSGVVAPGLYVGIAGSAVASLTAGRVLDDVSLTTRGIELLRSVGSQTDPGPDLLTGASGILRAHVLAWHLTGRDDLLREAVRRADELVVQQSRRSRRGLWPEARLSPGAAAWLGYAHGAAGIADCLLDVYRITESPQIERAIKATISLMQDFAMPYGSGLGWPATSAEDTPSEPRWCHGSVGIGRFLHEAAEAGFKVDPRLPGSALKAALEGGVLSGPSLCHGAAGVADLMLDLSPDTSTTPKTGDARRLPRILEAYIADADPGEALGPDGREGSEPQLLTGYGGVLLWAVRSQDTSQRDPLRPSTINDW